MPRIDDAAIRRLFTDARTHNTWQAKDVPDAMLREVVEIMRMGPTSMNVQPARIIFVRSPEAKAKLKPCLSPGNADKTMAAPVTAIVAYDSRFFENIATQFPAAPTMGQMAQHEVGARSHHFFPSKKIAP